MVTVFSWSDLVWIAAAFTLVCVGVALLMASYCVVYGWGTNHGDNHPTEKGCEVKSLKEYAKNVDDMKCKQDDIDKDKILNLSGVNQKQKDCIDKRAKLGDELYSAEVMHCEKRNN
jgi:hypothetical protein